MEFNVTLIPGDGIGPEIVREARKVLDRVAEKYGHRFTYKEVLDKQEGRIYTLNIKVINPDKTKSE